MSNDFAIRLSGVGKMYKLFHSRQDNFLDAIGITSLFFPKRHKFSEFWALRNITLELKRGQRIGIIGRNGAGKSTLLRLITGNFAPTEGNIEIKGKIQALFDVGYGFHPEFTGYENIRASLIYQGLRPREIELAIEDIADFTELGPFFKQPFKTYSLGMQSRLAFATATTFKPDILIVDEILGSGDAYFTAKSVERMRQLTIESGASVLIASHALGEIIRYCEETVWIERGHIVKQGPTMEVVAAYEGFIHTLEDRRLRAKNRKIMKGTKSSFQLENYSDVLGIVFMLRGESGATCDISTIQLLKNGKLDDELRVGDAQDTNTSFSACVVMQGSQWSDVQYDDAGYFRSLTVRNNPPSAQAGYTAFYSYGLFGDEYYTLRVRYRCSPNAKVSLTVNKNDDVVHVSIALPNTDSDWIETEVPIKIGEPILSIESQEPQVEPLSNNTCQIAEAETTPTAKRQEPQIEPTPTTVSWKPDVEPMSINQSQESEDDLSSPVPKKTRRIVRWPSEGSITIDKVNLYGANGEEQFVFRVGSPMTVCMTVIAHRDGHFELIVAATLLRLDGIFVTNFVSEPMPLDMVKDETREFRLEIPSLKLGDGNFVFSLSIFEAMVSDESRYDLIDRSFEFKVVGNEAEVKEAVFQHEGRWNP